MYYYMSKYFTHLYYKFFNSLFIDRYAFGILTIGLMTKQEVNHHIQYFTKLKSITEDRYISLISDTGMDSIMKVVLVGCVEAENPDCVEDSRTHTLDLAECPRNADNVWVCRKHLSVGCGPHLGSIT